MEVVQVQSIPYPPNASAIQDYLKQFSMEDTEKLTNHILSMNEALLGKYYSKLLQGNCFNVEQEKSNIVGNLLVLAEIFVHNYAPTIHATLKKTSTSSKSTDSHTLNLTPKRFVHNEEPSSPSVPSTTQRKRKRKIWTEEEHQAFLRAVKHLGEGRQLSSLVSEIARTLQLEEREVRNHWSAWSLQQKRMKPVASIQKTPSNSQEEPPRDAPPSTTSNVTSSTPKETTPQRNTDAPPEDDVEHFTALILSSLHNA